MVNAKRPPLLPSEGANNAPPHRVRDVSSSRYLSSSSLSSSSSSSFSSNSSSSSTISSRRSQSPLTPTLSRSVTTIKRKADISNAVKVLMTSTRSLSVSFQGESFKLPVSKAKPAPAPAPAPVSNFSSLSNATKGTPESPKVIMKDQLENVKNTDQYRWPGKSKAMNSSVLTRSLDYGMDKSKLFGSSNGNRDSKNFVMDDNKRKETRLKSKTQCDDDDANSGSILIKSVDSVSSGSSSRGIVVPARFLQDVNRRVRKEVELDPGLLKSKKNESKIKSPSVPIGAKKNVPRKPESLSKVESVSGRYTSPIRGVTGLASISKGLFTSVTYPAPRGRPSPTRTKNGMVNVSHDNDTPSILSFTANTPRVRAGENKVNDAHELRMLYNRQLQWRYINARAEAALSVQSGTAERSLYNAWVSVSKLRHSIRSKRIQLQLLRQNLKLYSILKGQASYLESWSKIDPDHCISLSEARQALQTSVANLPLVDGARADIQLIKSAMCSAADVMQGMTSSIGFHLIMVEQLNLLASELANTTANEIALIDQSKNLMSELTAFQVYDCSLKTHILQLPREASSFVTQV